MKTLCIILIALILLMCMPEFNITNIEVLNGTYYFFTTENYEDSNSLSVSSGNGYVISCKSEFASQLYRNLDKNKIVGISVETSDIDINSLVEKLNIEVCQTQNLKDISFIYGYSNRLTHFVTVDNQKINIQIAKTLDKIKIGYPLIFDSV